MEKTLYIASGFIATNSIIKCVCAGQLTQTFYLNGEIDKAAYPILRTMSADRAKPDLLVHKPGYIKGNHASIEVKSPAADADGIRKDL